MYEKGRDASGRVVSRPTASQALPAGSLDELARTAMAQIARSDRARRQAGAVVDTVGLPHVADLADALVAPDAATARAVVADILDGGCDLDGLSLDHLTPALRLLGERWVSDEMSFADVTLGSARVQSILRRLPADPTVASRLTTESRSAIFASVPGEQHTLGVTMAADYFRRRGWDISLNLDLSHDALVARVAGDNRKICALSASGHRAIAPTRRLIEALRRRRPDLAIVLSGNLSQHPDYMAQLPPVDGVVGALDEAEGVLSRAGAAAATPAVAT